MVENGRPSIRPGSAKLCRVGNVRCLPPLPFIITPHHILCGVDEMGKPAKDLVERVGGMGRPPGKIKNDIFQKWSAVACAVAVAVAACVCATVALARWTRRQSRHNFLKRNGLTPNTHSKPKRTLPESRGALTPPRPHTFVHLPLAAITAITAICPCARRSQDRSSAHEVRIRHRKGR